MYIKHKKATPLYTIEVPTAALLGEPGFLSRLHNKMDVRRPTAIMLSISVI